MRKKGSTNFNLIRRGGNPLNCKIKMSFHFSGQRLEYYTGFSVDEEYWDMQSQRVKEGFRSKNGESTNAINKQLNKIENTIEDIHTEYNALRKSFQPVDLKLELKKRLNETIYDTNSIGIDEAFGLFIESKKDEWKNNTKERKEIVKDIIAKFHEKSKTAPDFSSISIEYFKSLIQYSINTLKHKNTTIAKNLKIFKGFLNWAFENKYCNHENHKKFSIDSYFKGILKPSDAISLSKDEVMKLYKHKFDTVEMQQVRDVFCFSCFTGLRYSDLKNLKKANIKDGYIKLLTIKGNKEIVVDLNKFSLAILKRYENLPTDRCLPVPDNATLNIKLKEMGKILKFESDEEVISFNGRNRVSKNLKRYDLITTHTARRTFITTALVMNIPAQVIMKWTGHSDYKSFEGYVRITEEDRKKAMKKFNTWK